MIAAALVIAFSGIQNSGAGEPLSATPPPVKAAPEHCPSVIAAVRFYSRRLSEWKVRMGAGSTLKPRRLTACPRYLAHVLQRKARAAQKAYVAWHGRFSALYEKWRCIHEHEGAWNSNTGNGYWGGLQMDWGFMHTYGPEFIRRWGYANNWPVYAQLIAAERAFYGFAGYGGRGYSPWGTRGACGV